MDQGWHTAGYAAQAQEAYKKRLLVLRTALQHRGYFRALLALEYALEHHGPRFRKDLITPEFDHPVSIALYHLSLPDLMDPEGVIATDFLHDVPEDFGRLEVEIAAIFRPKDRDFGIDVARSSEMLNKYNRDGTPKDEEPMWKLIAHDVRASIVKPGDRVHNLLTMNSPKNEIGEAVFALPKQVEYADYAEHRVLPMMKVARNLFPEQNRAYENMKWMLRSQISLVRAMAGHVGRVSAKVIEIKTGS